MRLSRHDFRLAARSLSRHRGFAAVAVLSLALAIALNTTMYSVLDAMISPVLDLRAPDRLYAIRLWGDYKHKVDDATRNTLLRAATRSFEDVSYAKSDFFQTFAIEFGRRYAQVPTGTVAPNFFRMIGAHPSAGRIFTDADFTADTRTVVISERLATQLSPDRPFPIGAVIDVDAKPAQVIGVLGRSSVLPGMARQDAWLLPPSDVALASLPINYVRLRGDVPLDRAVTRAVTELGVVSARLASLAGESPRDTWLQLVPATDGQFHVANFHYALIAAVVAVLLIACANLANLQLARGIGRSRELALRAALGASRMDIISQLVVESALLSAAGLIGGLVLTFWGVHLLASRIPPSVAAYVIAPQISWRVLAVAAMASVICTVLVGLGPAIRVSRVDPNELLKSGNGTGANKKNRRQYGVMVAVEIGLSLAVLSGAAVVVRAARLVRASSADVDVHALSDAELYLASPRDTAISTMALANELVGRLRSMPDAADAAFEMSQSVVKGAITVDERGGTPREVKAPMFRYLVVSPSYLRTYDRPIVAGRDFLEGAPSEPEVIVDRGTADALWPNVDPIGMQLKLGDAHSDAPWARVVGVVSNKKTMREIDRFQYTPPRTRGELGEILYLPGARDSVTLSPKLIRVEMIARAKADPERMPITLARYLPRAGIVRYVSTSSLETRMGITLRRQSHDFVASVFAVFAAMAIGLAALGIYGIVSHSVAERTRELGVRIALGASARDVVHAVLRDGNPVALAGVAVGLWFTKESIAWLHTFSFENDEHDAVLFAIVGVVLFATAVLAALPPAWRATRIDPVESLRSE